MHNNTDTTRTNAKHTLHKCSKGKNCELRKKVLLGQKKNWGDMYILYIGGYNGRNLATGVEPAIVHLVLGPTYILYCLLLLRVGMDGSISSSSGSKCQVPTARGEKLTTHASHTRSVVCVVVTNRRSRAEPQRIVGRSLLSRLQYPLHVKSSARD